MFEARNSSLIPLINFSLTAGQLSLRTYMKALRSHRVAVQMR